MAPSVPQNGSQDDETDDGGSIQCPHHGDAMGSLLKQADWFLGEERLLEAARAIHKCFVELEERHEEIPTDLQPYKRILQVAADCQVAFEDLMGDPSGHGWKLGRTSSPSAKYPSMIYFRLEGDSKLTCRIESPIPESLLIPLLSVLNETKLYTDWIPSWNHPVRVGIRTMTKLSQTGRANQSQQIVTDSPWPFSPREVLLKVVAVDEIDHAGYVGVRLRTMVDEENADDDGSMPPQIIVFGACPDDHDVLKKTNYNKSEEPLILVVFKIYMDPKMAGIPISIVNFVTRTVMGSIWDMLLTVAQGVRDGTRPRHQAAIAKKAQFYEWMKARIHYMLEKLKQDGGASSSCFSSDFVKREEDSVRLELSSANVEDQRFLAYIQG